MRVLALVSFLVAAIWIDTLDGLVYSYLRVPVGLLHWMDGIEQDSMHDWLGVTLGAALLDRAAGGAEQATTEDPWVALGLKAPTGKRITKEEWEGRIAKANEQRRQSVVLFATRDVWEWLGRLAGWWLAMASVVGLLGWRAPFGGRRGAYWLVGATALLASSAAAAWVKFGGADNAQVQHVAIGWLALSAVIAILYWNPVTLLRQSAGLMILSSAASVGAIEIAIRWGGMPPDADWALYAKVGGIQSSYAWLLLIATIRMR